MSKVPVTPFHDEKSFKDWVNEANKDEKKATVPADFADPSPEELGLMAEVREMIDPKFKDTVTELQLSRFVRGYAFGTFWTAKDRVERTAIMLNLALHWFDSSGAKGFPDEDFERRNEWDKLWPQTLPGQTENGQIIWFMICPSDISKAFSGEETLKFHIQDMERMGRYKLARMQARNEKYSGQRHVIVCDLNSDRGSVSKAFANFFKECLVTKEGPMITQNFYPDCLEKTVMINAPFWVRAVWAFAKNLIDATTAAKFHIHGSDYMDALNKVGITEATLPMCVGGTAPNPLGHLAKLGSLSKGKEIELVLVIPEGHTKVKWTFTTDASRSIAFSLIDSATNKTFASGNVEEQKSGEFVVQPKTTVKLVITNPGSKSSNVSYCLDVVV
eukprot:m.34213 g.34213  ORF g.34213 m.34213 type:complete len:388 (-) comp16947_c0_seq1:62-1225(-)